MSTTRLPNVMPQNNAKGENYGNIQPKRSFTCIVPFAVMQRVARL